MLYKKIQESPAVADKPARRESMPKIAPIRRAYMYNVVADNTGLSSFMRYTQSAITVCSTSRVSDIDRS